MGIMNREELSSYIDNCYMMGHVVNKNHPLYKEFCTDACYPEPDILLGTVCLNDMYFRKDNEGKIHLVYCDTYGETLDLGDSVDIVDDTCTLSFKHIRISSMKVIPSYILFGDCLESFRGDNVEIVELHAFTDCYNLRHLILPKAKVIYTRGTDFSNVEIMTPNTCRFTARKSMDYKKEEYK